MSFVSSDPNIGMPVKAIWPKYDSKNREYLSVQQPCTIGKDFGEENFNFWKEEVEPLCVLPTSST